MKLLNFFKKEKTLVLIEAGGIGDYVFIRPYLKFIKQSEKFKNHKIVYVTKDAYIDFTLMYDRNLFDEVISYDDKKFSKDKSYTKYILDKFKKYKIDTLVNLRGICVPYLPDVHPRRELVKRLKAKTKITDVIKLKDNKSQEKKLRIYDRLIYDELLYDFELDRKRRFFEKLLEIKIEKQKLDIIETPFTLKENYIVVSIGTLDKSRAYPEKHWIVIINYLIEKYKDKKILFIGSYSEHKKIEKLINSLNNSSNCINFAGKSKISDIPAIFSNCSLLLAVDTGTVHLAQLMNTKIVCISGGAFYGRFHPYDNKNVKYVYPKEFLDFIKDENNKKEAYLGHIVYKPDTIEPELVISLINDLNI